MPRLWILSDLHLEAMPYPERFQPAPRPFDVLVAAGDVWEGSVERVLDALARLAAGKPVVFVLGNHEHWNGALYKPAFGPHLAPHAVQIGGCQICAACRQRFWTLGPI